MSNKVRLYRFYNIFVEAYGEPFAICDNHFKNHITPKTCVLHKIANDSMIKCNQCGQENIDSQIGDAIESQVDDALEARHHNHRS